MEDKQSKNLRLTLMQWEGGEREKIWPFIESNVQVLS